MHLPENPVHSLKVPVVVRDAYILALEHASGMHFIHCDVKSWGPKVAIRLGYDFKRLQYLVNSPIYALHDPKDHKHAKFLGMYGFEYMCDFVDVDGSEKQLYKA